jgi:capsular polysaccharide biosynthesis protein
MTRHKEAADGSFAAASRAAAEQRLTEAEDARRLANVRIIQPARVPQRPTWTKPLMCIAGALLAALAAICWFIVSFITSDVFLTEAGLAYATGLPVLGVFPRVAGRMHPADSAPA